MCGGWGRLLAEKQEPGVHGSVEDQHLSHWKDSAVCCHSDCLPAPPVGESLAPE